MGKKNKNKSKKVNDQQIKDEKQVKGNNSMANPPKGEGGNKDPKDGSKGKNKSNPEAKNTSSGHKGSKGSYSGNGKRDSGSRNQASGRKSSQDGTPGQDTGLKAGASKWQHWSWYAKDQQAAADLAASQWVTIHGRDITLSFTGEYAKIRIPGIMKITSLPTLGYARNFDGSIYNKAADQFYQILSQGYADIATFQASDLIMMLIGAMSCVVVIEEGKKMYGLMRYASATNSYLPRALIEAIGFDYASFMANKANFRAQLNTYIDMVNSIVPILDQFPLLQRWLWEYGNVFADSDHVDKMQFFVVVPYGYPTVDETFFTTGTSLMVTKRPSKYTFASYFAMLDTMLGQFRTNTEALKIFSGIKKVYTEGTFLKIAPLAEDATTPITVSTEAMQIIHNAEVIPESVITSLYDGTYIGLTDSSFVSIKLQDVSSSTKFPLLYQNTQGHIVGQIGSTIMGASPSFSALYYGAGSRAFIEKKIIDVIHDDSPTPEELLDLTTWIEVLAMSELKGTNIRYESAAATPSAGYFAPLICRASIVTAIEVLEYDDSQTLAAYSFKQYVAPTDTNGVFSNVKASQFDLTPVAYMSIGWGADNAIMGEVTNYHYVDAPYVQNIHEFSWNVLLALPTNDKSITTR